jgi:5-methylcytosine-specific restriction endonuclease McrA
MPGYRENETKEQYNVRMNIYMNERYHRRRTEAVKYLGGKCVDCGTTDGLEFDHKNPKQKSFAIGKKFASMATAKLYAEVDKCELRCRPCHLIKGGYDAVLQLDVLKLAKNLK